MDMIILQGCSTIQLTRGQNTLVDSRDHRGLSECKWQSYPSHGTYYAARTVKDYRRDKPKTCTKRLHRAVLEMHVGPCPTGMECRHLNGDSLDNRLGNLAWGTPSENSKDAIRHGNRPMLFRAGEPCLHNRGERNGSARLKASDIPEIRRLAAEGATWMSLATRYGVSHAAIYKIVNRLSWAHVEPPSSETEQEQGHGHRNTG